MNKSIINILMTGVVTCGTVLTANAQKFSLKPHVDIGVGSAMSLKSDLPDFSKSSNSTDFGVDFGYTFWQHMGNRLEANIGIGYSTTSIKLNAGEFSYHYNAPAAADEDGNTYIRYYDVNGIHQKLNLGYFTIPLYLTYGYQFNSIVGIHADLGFKFGFKCNSKLKSTTGEIYAYGVYPEYDDLMINAPYLNNFGNSELSSARLQQPEASGFYASLLVGFAFDVRVYGPLWFDAGLRYNCGFTNSFKHKADTGNYTSQTAPVTYLVKEGETVKPLTDYTTSSKLSPLQILVGFTVKF